MTEEANSPAPTAVIAEDAMTATLTLHPGGEPEDLPSVETCVALLRDAGVDVTEEVTAAVEELVQQHTDDPEHMHSEDVASGVAMVPGEPGWLEFHEGFDPDEDPDDETEPVEQSADHADRSDRSDRSDDGGAVDYYNRRAFCLVQVGDEIGVIHPATQGSPGRDVRGREIPLKPGQDYALKTDDTIEVRNDGTLVVTAGGVLEHTPQLLYVNPDLDVPGQVDFATGNICFNGDVVIEKGVRDCFVVEATGTITVRGLVEAATIIAGSGAVFESGMAAREKGAVRIAGDLETRYLDNVDGTIGGALRVEKELINCRLGVTGGVASPDAVLAGGRLEIGGSLDLAEIGSESGSTTEVVVGLSAEVNRLQSRAEEVIERIAERRTPLAREHENLERNLSKLSKEQQQRHRALSKALRELDELVGETRESIARLRRTAGRCATIDLTVQRMIHAGVALTLGDATVGFNEPVAGPVRVKHDSAGGLVIENLISGTVEPLASVARVVKVGEPGAEAESEPAAAA